MTEISTSYLGAGRVDRKGFFEFFSKTSHFAISASSEYIHSQTNKITGFSKIYTELIRQKHLDSGVKYDQSQLTGTSFV